MKFKNLIILFLAVVFLNSCKKKDGNVYFDSEGTLSYDGLVFSDSLTLLTKTVREDSLKTNALEHNLIGVLNDPDFGTSQSNSFFQFLLPTLNNVISNKRLDSAVLMLNYTSSIAFYGNLQNQVTVNFYELTEKMGTTITHSNQSYQYDNNPIGTFSGRFNPKDSVFIRQGKNLVKIPATLKVKLSNAFASKLFNANSSQLSSQNNFAEFMKGIAAIPTGSDGAMAAFNLNSSNTKIRVYYDDSSYSDFVFNTECKKFSQYLISNQNSNIVQQKQASKTQDFTSTYVQSLTGAKTQVMFPHLLSMISNPNKRIVISKAELIIRPKAGTFSDPFTLPRRMRCLPTDLSDSIIRIDNDELYVGVYGGAFLSATNRYVFNITKYIQNIFTVYQNTGQNKNKGVYVFIPTEAPIAPSRIIIDAQKKIPNAGIELKIHYTEL